MTDFRQPGELKARIKAAMAYADLNDAQAAKALGWSKRTFERRKTATFARQLAPFEQRAFLDRLAELCGLPIEFFAADWSRAPQIAPREPEFFGERSGEEFVRLTREAAQRPPGTPERRSGADRRTGDRRRFPAPPQSQPPRP